MKPVPRKKPVAKKEAPKKKVAKKSTGVKKKTTKTNAKVKGYPSYFKMIVQALDRIGKSGTPSILSAMSEDYPDFRKVSLERRKATLKNALEHYVENGHVRRVKNSYTLLAKGRKEGLKSNKTPKKRKTSTSTSTSIPKKTTTKKATTKKSTTDKKTTTKKKSEAPKKSTKRKAAAEPSPKKVAKTKETATPTTTTTTTTTSSKGKAKAKGKGKGKGKDSSAPVDKEVSVPAEGNIPAITTTGVVFNTTDLPHIRDDIKAIIGTLLQDDQIRVGIIANRGWANSEYNLETLNFTDDASAINGFVDNSYGEGANWLQYYKQVLTTALTLPWAMNRVRKLILIGDEGTSSLFDRSLEADVGRLRTIGVNVYGFHHSQLVLLNEVLQELN